MRRLVLFALLSSAVFAQEAWLQDITGSTTIVPAKILTLETFSASPANAVQGQTVEFTVRYVNDGNEALDVNTALTVNNSAGSTVFSKNFSTSSLSPGSAWLTRSEWSTGSNPLGEYTATATSQYDGNTTSSSTAVSIYMTAAAPAVGVGVYYPPYEAKPLPIPPEVRGEQPLGTFFGKPKPYLEISTLPVRIDMTPGMQDVSWLVFSNDKAEAVEMRVEVQGLPADWVKVERAFTVPAGGFKTTAVALTIPTTAPARDYIARMIVLAEGEQLFENFFVVKVMPGTEGEKPEVFRSISVNPAEKSTQVELSIVNLNTHAESMALRENVPKTLAQNVSEINFSVEPTRVVEPDPVVEWFFKDLRPMESKTVSYEVGRVVADYNTYLYWTTEQLSVGLEKPVEKAAQVQITDVFAPVFRAGAGNRLSVSTTNFALQEKDVLVTFRLPAGWTAPQRGVLIPPATVVGLAFEVSLPPDAKPGTYTIQIFAGFEDVFSSREVSLTVAEAVPAFLPADFLIVLLLSAGIATGVFAIREFRKAIPAAAPKRGRKP